MEKKELYKKTMCCFIEKKEFSRIAKAVINNMDCSQYEDDFLPAYAVASAIYEPHITWMQHGGSEESNRLVKRIKKGLWYLVRLAQSKTIK